MEPITAIASAITSIKTATEIAQLLKTSDETFIKAELKLKLAELMSALADTKIAVSELKEIILEKDQEIKRIIDKQKINESIIFVDPVYRKRMDNGQMEGFYCPRCFDAESKLIRLDNNHDGSFNCKNCKSIYADESYYSNSGNDINNSFNSREF
jgi:transposase-like protein